MRLLGKALTFDDVLLVPAYSQVLPKDTSLATQFTRDITLNLPLVSAAMDTVTEARLAIAIAQEGGIGIVHKNLTAAGAGGPSGQGQALRIGRAARPGRHHPGAPRCTRSCSCRKQLGMSGFPVVDGGKVVGIVTGRDLRFETRYDLPVQRDHDAARAPDHRQRRHHARSRPRRCSTSTSWSACWWSTTPSSSRA